jgi:CBS domain-containing protein
MHRNTRIEKQGDKLLKMPGKLDRGSVEFKSRIVGRTGDVMGIATTQVISVPQTMTIIDAVKVMCSHGFRRLPVTDAGTHKLRGIVTAGDIIDFMGGGSRYNLVQVKHKGNMLAAVNESVREIMTSELVTLNTDDSIEDAVSCILSHRTGGLPIIDDDGILRGIITERDVMELLSKQKTSQIVEDVMTASLKIIDPATPVGTATQEMVKHHFRRLPVVSEDILIGIVTASDILKYLGSGEAFNQLVTGDSSEIMALPVRELISGPLHTTTPEKNLQETALEMLDKHVGALPVIENSRLVGLVTEFDLVKALAER